MAAAKAAMAPYQDYRKALADGYENLSSQYSATPISLYEV